MLGKLTVAISTSALLVTGSVGLIATNNQALPPTNDDLIQHLELTKAGCEVMLQTATSSAQRTRANNCISDANRALADLTTTPSPSPTATSTPSPSPSNTTVPPTTTTPAPTTTTTPPGLQWPNPGNTGVPAFWQPVTTRSTNLTVTTNDTIVEDVLFTNGADLIISGDNVRVRRVLFQGGRIDNIIGNNYGRGLQISRSTFRRPSGTVNSADQEGINTAGGYTLDGVLIDSVIEGVRAGQKNACGGIGIANSFIRIQPPDSCSNWHGDGVQGFDGGLITVRNVAIDFQERSGCGGTAPFFNPRDQGNTAVDIDRLIVKGGGYSFRNGMPGRVVNLHIVQDWGYGPIDVRCSVMNEWLASVSTVDADWNPTIVRGQPCNTESGF